MINKENYPVYLLSFMEGKLKPEEMDALLQFIEEHPELKEEIEGLENIRLEPEDELYDHKEMLFRNPYPAEESLFVAALENDLEEEKRKAFFDWIEEDHDRKKTFLVYQQTKLKYDSEEVFEHKNKLYQNISITRFYYYAAAAAIILMLLIPGLFVFNRKWDGADQNLTQQETTKKVYPSHHFTQVIIPKNTLTEKERSTLKRNSEAEKTTSHQPKDNRNLPAPFQADSIYTNPEQVLAMQKIPAKQVEVSTVLLPALCPVSEENPVMANENPSPENNKKTYSSPKQWLLAEIRKQANKNIQSRQAGEDMAGSKMLPAELAGLLLGGINRITGSSLKLVYERGSRGQITAMGISGKSNGMILGK